MAILRQLQVGGLRRKKRLWPEGGRKQLESFKLDTVGERVRSRRPETDSELQERTASI